MLKDCQACPQSASYSELTPKRVLQQTIDYRDFSESIVKKIINCEIPSAMLPLLADHALRETNYFIRLLKQQLEIANSLSQAAN